MSDSFQTAVVTGASRGFGRAIAAALVPRYAENARALLTTMAEEQVPASSAEPKGQNRP